MDEALRNLERAAAGGDPLALESLQQARKRANLCLDCGGTPREGGYTHCLKCQPLSITWDTYEIAKNQADFLREEDPDLTEDEAFATACAYDTQHEWDHMAYELGQWIEEINRYEADWLVTYSNAGWQHRSGEAVVEWNPRTEGTSESEAYFRSLGNAFIHTILPNTDCTFTIYFDGEGFNIRNAHHDAPTGETYQVIPGISCEYCDNLHPTQEEADTCCYLCPVCEENYHSEKEANNCCFVCPHCKSVTSWGVEIPTVHSTKEEMEDCCHLCSSCEEAWDTIEEAQACCATESRYRYNPDPGLEKILADLEDDYFELPLYLRRKDLITINNIREELGLPLVNANLRPIKAPETKQQQPQKPQIKIDKHKEARQIYQDYLGKVEEMKPQLEYSKHVIREVTRGQSMTPVMPLAIMGTNGGPILCDHCHKAIPLEGGKYHGVPANIAWEGEKDPQAGWTSYILGGLVTFQHSNHTARFYHGYASNSSSCYNLAMKELDAAEESFNKNKINTGRISSLLRKFIEDEMPEISSEDRGRFVMNITNTLYGYDPGIGINRAT
jgi:hypothetical protein